MGLKEGTLEALIDSGTDASAIAESVFPQMLQALDCIAWKGIVHRDVKPENILYVSLSQPDSQYQFQLGDFGLCNRIIDAATFVGTYLYMAPEMHQEGDQTDKVDVWSLFVTMMWVLDAGGFRQRPNRFKNVAEVQRAVLSAASNVDSVQRFGKWQSSTRKNELLQHRCFSSTSTEKDSALHGIRSQLSPAALLPLSASPGPRSQLLPLRQLELDKSNLEVCKWLRMYSQQLRTVSTKRVTLFKQNPSAGERSGQKSPVEGWIFSECNV